MILLLDNYDSFTWNLAQILGQLDCAPKVIRNDQITVDEVVALKPAGIVISPGPRTPAEAGISIDLIRRAALESIPTLGVCLGHQAIAQAFGGSVIRASRQMHGKITALEHTGVDLFLEQPSPLPVMRYHSLIVANEDFPECLEITAWSGDRDREGEIMALRHRSAPLWGVQFHPESIGTPSGPGLVERFVQLSRGAC